MAEATERELTDDPRIAGDVGLIRQVSPLDAARHVDWRDLDASGRPRVTSMAFQRSTQRYADKYGYPALTISVYLESVIVAEYSSVKNWMDDVRPGWGAVRVPAQLFRDGDMGLQRDDLEGRLGHTVAWAMGSNNAARRTQSPLAQAAVWFVPPRQPGI